MIKKYMTRREFVHTSSAITGSFYLGLPWCKSDANENKSKVILIRDEKILDHLM